MVLRSDISGSEDMKYAILRYVDPDGNLADRIWEAQVREADSSLIVKQRRDGRRSSSTRFPMTVCKNHSPGEEMAEQRHRLLKKGWVDVRPPVVSVEEANQQCTGKSFGEPSEVWF